MGRRRRRPKKQGGGIETHSEGGITSSMGEDAATFTDKSGPVKPGSYQVFAIPLKARNLGTDRNEAQRDITRFADRIAALLDEPEFASIEACAHGEEAMSAFAHGFRGHEMIAEALAASKARDN